MDREQQALAQDLGDSALLRNSIADRWDGAFGAGRYRFGTVAQYSRRWIACAVSNADAAFVAKITIPPSKVTLFDFKTGDSLSDGIGASNYTTTTDDTSLSKPNQLDPDEEMVIEKFAFHSGLIKPKWVAMPYGITAGDIVHDAYGTLFANEVSTGKALHDAFLDAFLSNARVTASYNQGKQGLEILGPGILAAGGGPPYGVGKNRPVIERPEGLFWGSENDPTKSGSASDSKLTITLETVSPIYLIATFASAARTPTNVAFNLTCVASGVLFSPTKKTN